MIVNGSFMQELLVLMRNMKIFTDDGKTIALGPVKVTWDTYAKSLPPYCGWFIYRDRVGQWGAFVMEDATYFNNMLTIDIPLDA